MGADEYILTSSMQARAIARQGRDALIALAKDDFKTAVRALYQGALEKAKLGDSSALHQHKGSADEMIVQSALGQAYNGWRRLTLAVTGERQATWRDAIGSRTYHALYSYIRGFHADVPHLRARYAAVRAGAIDDIIDAAVSAAANDIPEEFALAVIDGGFQER